MMLGTYEIQFFSSENLFARVDKTLVKCDIESVHFIFLLYFVFNRLNCLRKM